MYSCSSQMSHSCFLNSFVSLMLCFLDEWMHESSCFLHQLAVYSCCCPLVKHRFFYPNLCLLSPQQNHQSSQSRVFHARFACFRTMHLNNLLVLARDFSCPSLVFNKDHCCYLALYIEHFFLSFNELFKPSIKK